MKWRTGWSGLSLVTLIMSLALLMTFAIFLIAGLTWLALKGWIGRD